MKLNLFNDGHNRSRNFVFSEDFSWFVCKKELIKCDSINGVTMPTSIEYKSNFVK